MEDTASITKIFFPNADAAYNVIRKIDLDPVMVQVMTGHGGFSEYLNRFKCKDSPSCPCDPAKKESIVHILTECPINGLERFELESKIDKVISVDNISTIMSDKSVRNEFIKYCKEVARKVINKNK
ncbi:hypothetical protein O0L34_g4680 [Tuta absoluta]|nr:hypothetical protein O0L34_g4680 [Tuta absoluta]